jgi:hypothetical protein
VCATVFEKTGIGGHVPRGVYETFSLNGSECHVSRPRRPCHRLPVAAEAVDHQSITVDASQLRLILEGIDLNSVRHRRVRAFGHPLGATRS